MLPDWDEIFLSFIDLYSIAKDLPREDIDFSQSQVTFDGKQFPFLKIEDLQYYIIHRSF